MLKSRIANEQKPKINSPAEFRAFIDGKKRRKETIVTSYFYAPNVPLMSQEQIRKTFHIHVDLSESELEAAKETMESYVANLKKITMPVTSIQMPALTINKIK